MYHNNFCVEVHKTRRIDVNDSAHSLPPSLGLFSEFKVSDYFCPDTWSKDGFFIPVDEEQPLWFDFRKNLDECACIPSIQKVNPITGQRVDLSAGLSKDPKQNYLYLPDQLWLDGYANDGKVYQFIVTKSGIKMAVNEYVLPEHEQDSHAVSFIWFKAKNPKPRQTTIYPYNMKHYFYQPIPQNYSFDLADTPMIGYSGPSAGMSAGDSSSANIYNSLRQNAPRAIKSASLVSRSAGIQLSCNTAQAFNHVDANEDSGNAIGTPDSVDNDTIETEDVLNAHNNADQNLAQASMGMGGRIQQDIVSDPNSTDYYEKEHSAILTIYMALPEQFKSIINKGKRQDFNRKDKHVFSGNIGGIPVPLMVNN